MRWTILLALLPTLTLAQSSAPRPEDLGTVTGHITCADTQRPARLAEVRLVSVRDPTIYSLGYQIPTVGSGVTGLAAHTDLAGGYTIAEVPPGQYYLRVDLPGYATPISQFAAEDLKSPHRSQQRIQSELQLVTVAPNATVQVDATLHRAGSISGSMTYEDGSPAIAIRVTLLHRDANGKLREARNGASAVTNGHGQFSIESLLPGNYVIEAKLVTFERWHSPTLANGSMKLNPDESATSFLPVYSGNVFRQKDASIIKVDAGQEVDDSDISIPLGQLHEVSGTVLAKDSHAINSFRIELLDPDTREPVATTWARDEGAFNLLHVPEGRYILKVIEPRDVSPLEVHVAPDHISSTVSRRTLHTYGTLEQPLTVQTDIQSLNLTLPNNPSPPNNSTGNN